MARNFTGSLSHVASIVLGFAFLACSGGEAGLPGGGAASDDLSTASVAEKEAIGALLADQVAAWNDADLDAFMQGYLNSGELRFVSGAEVRYGWEAALERYRQTYPDRAAMGTLSFEDLDVRLLGSDWAMVFGAFRLVRAQDEPRGRFTLILHREDEGWRIVHDHTSS